MHPHSDGPTIACTPLPCKPSLPVMVPHPREHLSASSSNPPPLDECRLCFLQKVLGAGLEQSHTCPSWVLPTLRESARKPNSVWTKTLYPYGSSSPGKGPHPLQCTQPSRHFLQTAQEPMEAPHSWGSGSALGFCLLGQVKPSGLRSPLPMSPRPQKAVSQTEPSLPMSPQEGGSGRGIRPSLAPRGLAPKPLKPGKPR